MTPTAAIQKLFHLKWLLIKKKKSVFLVNHRYDERALSYVPIKNNIENSVEQLWTFL